MKLKKDLIEKLRNGDIAVKNDGDIEQLEAVLREAFPNDTCNNVIKDEWADEKYFYRFRLYDNFEWNVGEYTDLESISVKDFFEEEFKWGDNIEYRNVMREWNECIYIGKNPIPLHTDRVQCNYIVMDTSKGYNELTFARKIRHKQSEETLADIIKPYVDEISRLNIEMEEIINKAGYK